VDELRIAIENSYSWSDVFRKLEISISGGSMKTARKVADENNLDYSHFRGRGWLKGRKWKNYSNNTRSLVEILVINSSYSTSMLRKRLIDAGLKTHKCESCGRVKWLNNKIPLEVDHINGISNDHRIENLRLLCPNCHALTPTWRGRNRKCNKRKLGDRNNPVS
jgi:5-methylcytosine-specific restriction endonuclease McrA